MERESPEPQNIKLTGETLVGPAEAAPTGSAAHKGGTRKRGNEAGQESEAATVPMRGKNIRD
jgi:hypothetical protein